MLTSYHVLFRFTQQNLNRQIDL